MKGTPQLRSAFPSTPQRRSNPSSGQDGPPSSGPEVGSPLPELAALRARSNSNAPVIPFDVIDAPSQRLYVVGFYVALLAWRLYDFYLLDSDDAQSLWLFMKWVAIDGVFLFGLPALRIPWLEWSSVTMTVLFLLHSMLDGILMFRINLPFSTIFVALSKLLYDREIAISERSVKPGSIIHNASVILGKQVIHILPDGSAMLNPAQQPFCLDTTRTSVHIPIQVNQTNPILIELRRVDLDTLQNETITIPSSTLKRLRKDTDKARKAKNTNEPRMLEYTVKKTGVYSLQRVLDESQLEVQRILSDVVVVPCPEARIKPTQQNRCKGELSDIVLEVEGVPPLRLKYRKVVNGIEREATFQNIQLDDSPASVRPSDSLAVVVSDRRSVQSNIPQRISVPLNESLITGGEWTYSVEEVRDTHGNSVSYSHHRSQNDRPKTKHAALERSFIVHERPSVQFRTCNSQRPIKIAKDELTELPLQYSWSGSSRQPSYPFNIEYMFIAEEHLQSSDDHERSAVTERITFNKAGEGPIVRKNGLYTLKSISTAYCVGDVLEPASCLIQHSPEPALSVSTEEIFDKCAGNPIGLRVTLELIGTPPFEITYMIQKKGDKDFRVHSEMIDGLRGQLELTPPKAGHYTYTFVEMSDLAYKTYPLVDRNLVIEQDVKPAASAHFVHAQRKTACIGDAVSVDVKFQGEGPWTLEYELVHGGKRTKRKIPDIQSETFSVNTEELKSGGTYSLALVSITDGLGCKEPLEEEKTINVRHQRPKAAFGHIDGIRSVHTLEGQKVQLPLRLSGEPEWTVQYKNTAKPGPEFTKFTQRANDVLEVKEIGTYELVAVKDRGCPGSVDQNANTFNVSWIPRPDLSVIDSPLLEAVGGRTIRKSVCEGDEDTLELSLRGTPPFDLKYEEHHIPDKGTKSLRRKEISAALNAVSIPMDTSHAGLYEYKFTELGDSHYSPSPKKGETFVVRQQVHPRPVAQFDAPGKTYSYCSKDASGEEVIPITLTGTPPFYLELEIKHNGAAPPETISFPNINSHKHNLKVPHRNLQVGHSYLAIRKVRDSRGCQRKPPPSAPRVQISVHEPPSITPLESQTDYCVGERLSFALAGVSPFTVFYTFEGVARRANSAGTTFRRLAEKPGVFTITGVQDSASECRSNMSITKTIHGMPTVRLSQGREAVVDIRAGGAADLLFELGGTPPFEFTYTRSANAKKGRPGEVLESRTETTNEHSLRIKATEEGTYEVVAIRDAYCSFRKPGFEKPKSGQKLLQF